MSDPAAPAAVVETLENGLTIIVREDASAPVVSAQAWCRAGSMDEGRWLGAGLSHVLEHMLFKGTTTRGAGRIDQEVQEAGGHMNAYTSFDRTVYWINVPDTGARVAVDILADIVQHATLPAAELVKEQDVIRREMDMCHDDPGRRAGRRLFETAYRISPARYPVIGLPDIFNTITREDLAAYYREKYAPNNLFFVVVGRVAAGEVIGQLQAAFAGARARPLPATPLPAEPRQTAPREVVEEAAVQLGHLHASWHVPDLRHPDLPALDVLAVLLGGGRSSRLHQVVREQRRLVHSVDAWTYSPGHPGLFGLSAVMDGEHFPPAREALLAEVGRVQAEPVREEELAKAVRQLTVSTLSARKTMQGQAQDLGGNWLAAGDLEFSDRCLAAVRRTTPADVQRVARAYLAPENRALYALLPAGHRPRAALAPVSHRRGPVGKFTLPNGLRVLVREDHRLPFVQLRAVCRGGVLAETAETSGLGALMTRTLVKGAGGRPAEAIAAAIESVGGSLDTYAGNNSFGVTAEVLAGDAGLGLGLVADVLLRPAFPDEEVERERLAQLAAVRAQRDQLLQLAGLEMRRALFGPAGYGLNLHGEEQTVAGFAAADLRAHHARLAVPGNAVLAVYGAVDTAAERAEVERCFGGWSGPAADLGRPVPAAPPPPAPAPRTVTCEKKQAVLVMGFPAPALDHPDRFALELVQEACSDLGSRLFLRIRDELGLAYYVGAQHFNGLGAGWFSLYAGTGPAAAEQVAAEFRLEVERLREHGLTADELRRAKAKLLGQRKISREDLGHLAFSGALDELYGLGHDHAEQADAVYEAVTAEAVLAAVRKWLVPAQRVLAVVRPAAA
ncbi:MAG TPA: pitrilysin family protein [Verrucomicrobiota bacterium]|nr:pitrilysin family protein [Verrucomicrobiota bacterium]